ncbi:MAG: Heparinase II/III-like [uncultured Sulfurovum sp.]|uniref:Heparinase II/III-like n=1 Tax=uncultured Sulfurovum sp. TaxID=269237 RepID=A0A6S6TUP8_9BACT|nr:MAG: Heparinase II/III-like [uncultured Sulfurovum sp.]
MLSNAIRLFHTVKYLRPKQINYRLYYFFRKRIREVLGKNYDLSKSANTQVLKFEKSIHIVDCYFEDKKFSFLNLDKKFENVIDWNFATYGKLWTYNLVYFDYLSQDSEDDKLFLMESFIDSTKDIKAGLEPFPISLRGINWVKYLSFKEIRNKKIDDSLYAQYDILLDNLEYHLLGNHLLENGFSLLFAAYYFKDEVFYLKAKEILNEELEEQILKDGAHFELTPMYHQIMLFRVLDCINLVKNNSWKNEELLKFLLDKAGLMLGWLKNITYKNGEMPLFNDSTYGIAPSSLQLFDYAERLEVDIVELSLGESGYRKVFTNSYECILDVGPIGASYIPGHAHADVFNFELMVNSNLFIVDTGLSTYETNERRVLERSTFSHNTVEVNGESQSEVWAGFRVAKRANIINLEEGKDFVKATHDGYKNYGIYHTRIWTFKDSKIEIKEELNKMATAVSRLHFHPAVTKKEILKRVKCNHLDYKVTTYNYSPEFNTYLEALVLEVYFNKDLLIEIDLKEEV